MDKATVIDAPLTTPQGGLVLACIDAHPRASIILRAAQRLAEQHNVRWAALYIETPKHVALPENAKARLVLTLSRAQNMGAKTHTFSAETLEAGLKLAVKTLGVTHLVLGITQSAQKRNFPGTFKLPSFWQSQSRLARKLGKNELPIYFVPLSEEEEEPSNHKLTARWRPYLYSLLTVIPAVIITELLKWFITYRDPSYHLHLYNVAMIFLAMCMVASLTYGLLPGLFGGLIGFLMMDVMYIHPRVSETTGQFQDATAMAVFLLAALTVSAIASFSRRTRVASHKREALAWAFYRLNKTIAESHQLEPLRDTLTRELSWILEAEAQFFFPEREPGNMAKEEALSRIDRNALEHCFKYDQPSGIGTTFCGEASYHFQPMITARRCIGALGVKVNPSRRHDVSYIRLISTLADQSAVALERAELARVMEDSRLQQEREKIRSALLSSVSHDLKTPLAAIIGSLSAVRHMGTLLSTSARDTLMTTALDEAERLNRFITNILNMTRLESGAIKLKRAWVNPDDMISDVLRRLRHRITKHAISHMRLSEPLEAYLDATLMEQLLQNLLDNAVKYAPEGSTITLRSRAAKSDSGNWGWVFEICDEGPGIPEDKREFVFDKFFRLQKQDRQVAGTGLGLAICKAIVDVHGGDIVIRDNPKGGSIFVATFSPARPADSALTEAPLELPELIEVLPKKKPIKTKTKKRSKIAQRPSHKLGEVSA